LGVGAVVWGNHGGEERQVYAEGVLGHGAAAADLLAEIFGRGLSEGCELHCGCFVSIGSWMQERCMYQSETTGIANGAGELSVADPLHTTLNDRHCSL
jgi:hypothetical protein